MKKQSHEKWVQGQGLVEYILITALISLAAVAIFKSFRGDLQKAYQKAGQIIMNSVEDTSPSTGGDK